jgi:hypothetical protein
MCNELYMVTSFNLCSVVLLKAHSSLLLLLLQEALAGVQERPCGDQVQALLLRELRTQVSSNPNKTT